jgi:glutathione S-transferase
VLVEDGRATLWETDAIACRLSALAGSEFWRTGEEQPDMIRWISWAGYHLNRAADPLYFNAVVMPTFTADRLPEPELQQALTDWRTHLPVLDMALRDRDWLVGDALSYADFRVATALPFAEVAGLPLDAAPHVRAWRDRLDRIEAWREPFAGLG